MGFLGGCAGMCTGDIYICTITAVFGQARSRALSPHSLRGNYPHTMVDPLLVVFSVLLLVVGSAHAQVSGPNCSDPTYAWVSHPWLIAQFVKMTTRSPQLNALSPSTRLDRAHV